jgi:ABC-2 type transport system permease protein
MVLVNVLVHRYVYRWDMTDDQRYTISMPTKQLLGTLKAPLKVSILLDGELNAGFTRLKKATDELLDELAIYVSSEIQTITIDATTIAGLDPVVVHERTHKGKMAQTTLYPYVVVEYEGKKRVVNLLQNQRGLSGEENLNKSIESLEYNILEAIRSLVQVKVEKVAFLEGHGELDERDVYDLTQLLAQYYQVDRGCLGNEVGVLD